MLRSLLQHRQPQCSDIPLVLLYSQAETHIIQVTQQEHLIETIRAIENKIALPKDTAHLNPFLDRNGILRVGGRLQHSQLPTPEKHPVIIPKKSNITTLIIDEAHKSVYHQGRHLTLSGIIQNGYYIIGVRAALTSHCQIAPLADECKDKLRTL